MKNHLFSSEHIAVLSDMRHWRLIASALSNGDGSALSSHFKRWARSHTEAHSHREAIIILKGGGDQGLCGKSYPVTPGAVTLVDTMEKHQHGYPPSHPASEQLWFQFRPDFVHVKLTCFTNGRKRSSCPAAWERVYPLAALGLTSTHILFPEKSDKAPPEAVCRRCLHGLGMLVSAVIEKGYQTQPDLPREDFQSKVITAALKHIDETYGRNCSLENLSRLAGYSPCHFSRLFAKHAGTSLPKCVNAARAVGFQKMLAERMPLKAIAAELGFSHPSALSRWRRQQGL